MERPLFLEVLKHTHYNVSHAARILGLSRTTLRQRFAALGITLARTGSVDEEDNGA